MAMETLGGRARTMRATMRSHTAAGGRAQRSGARMAPVRAIAEFTPKPKAKSNGAGGLSDSEHWIPSWRKELIPFDTTPSDWSMDSWRTKEALQQPLYEDMDELNSATAELRQMPPLVFAGECRSLVAEVAKAGRGEAFMLFGGDCAESFLEFSADNIRDTFRVMLQMSVVLNYGGGLPTVKIGRMAGQFAKPRSAPTETIDGVELPSYRGDIINGPEFTPEARRNSPSRLVKAYNQSAATLNLLRAFSTGGYAAMPRIASWELQFARGTEQGQKYIDIARRVDDALEFMNACGVDTSTKALTSTTFNTAHEACLLEYEAAFCRQDSTTGLVYNTSAHMVWVGERTRQVGGAHLEMLRGVGNPVGVKISGAISPEELLQVLDTLNPNNTPGRVTLITRFGAGKLREGLPPLIRTVQDAGRSVTWVCDPMHGNTETSTSGYKTRRFDNVLQEVSEFFAAHDECGSVPGGVHLEMTGRNVTECTGGGTGLDDDDLKAAYLTHCDPRLNSEQALELAFLIAGFLRKRKDGKSDLF